MTAQPSSLFDAADIWLSDPAEAYAAFVLRPDAAIDKNGKPKALRESSINLYRARWSKFVRWLELADAPTGKEPRDLLTLPKDELAVFLAQLSPGSRYRYVRQIERVYSHLETLELRHPVGNIARSLAIAAPTRDSQGHLESQRLTQAQQVAFLAALPAPRNWKKARDRAMLALVIGAGLRVSEVLRTKPDHFGSHEDDGSLPVQVPAVGAGRLHRTRVQPYLAPIVQAWLNQRATLGIPGNLLFPAAVSGRPLSPTAAYRLVRRTLTAAGIPELDIPRRGTRLLRTTFALTTLGQGAPVAMLGEQLGLRSDRAARHYVQLAKA